MRSAQYDVDQIRTFENKRLWAISMNPLFPFITSNFKISVPVIELLYVFYIVGSSFYWRNLVRNGVVDAFYTKNNG